MTRRPKVSKHSTTRRSSPTRHGPRVGERSVRAATPTRRIELTFLPGLKQAVESELRELLPTLRDVRVVTGRDDAVWIDYADSWGRLLQLRTVVAPFAVLTFEVPRPRSLTSSDHLGTIARTVGIVGKLNQTTPPTSFRIEAAGHDSPTFQRLAELLAAETGLDYDETDGDVVLRFRPSVERSGWDVLVRLSTRPLSQRAWRVRDFPGAVNATIAAAIVRATKPKPGDRVANLMCGSGTLLIERLLAAPAKFALGVDNDPAALADCVDNLRAAGLRDRVQLIEEDLAGDGWAQYGPFDVLLADPPWGGLVGDHATNDDLYRLLLQRAADVAAPGARFAILTHEIKLLERCLEASEHWRTESALRVYQKGPQPRIFLLTRS
jgi:tRNA (guanine6-N2)-methyltransferase